MTIRNIITSAAIVAALGLAGGSAYADDSDGHLEDYDFAVSANANEGDIAEDVNLVEEADLLDNEFDVIELN